MILGLDTSTHSHTFSHVQLRGTMPFLWKQTPDLGFNPPIEIYQDDQFNCQLMKKNYSTISKDYDFCTLLNNVNRKKKG